MDREAAKCSHTLTLSPSTYSHKRVCEPRLSFLLSSPPLLFVFEYFRGKEKGEEGGKKLRRARGSWCFAASGFLFSTTFQLPPSVRSPVSQSVFPFSTLCRPGTYSIVMPHVTFILLSCMHLLPFPLNSICLNMKKNPNN